MYKLIHEMSECPQTNTQSVLGHDLSVRKYAIDLIEFITDNKELENNWRLPDWLINNKKLISEELFDKETIEIYTLFHDCGKPRCLIYDSEGKKHFPNHANVSELTFREHFDNEQTARLIGMDMDIHLLKADNLEEFAQRKEAITLMIIGLAEIHSNADMFGGIESTSFKIKWKQINKRGNQILKIKGS